jgi:hypothetical protein
MGNEETTRPLADASLLTGIQPGPQAGLAPTLHNPGRGKRRMVSQIQTERSNTGPLN